jgi:hypothetical protein
MDPYGKIQKKLIGIKDQILPLIKPNVNLAVSDLEKADPFGEHLAKIFSPHDDIITTSEHTKIIKTISIALFLFHYQQNIKSLMK